MRGLVAIGNGDRERVRSRQSTVADLHAHRVRVLGFIVGAGRKAQAVAIDIESCVVRIAGAGDQSVGQGVVFRVGGAEGADDGVGTSVLGD